ncbi:hypothetical protein LYSHEL_27190 [Lysobacter helvus]|uniref:SH3b domain-containing protein n=2 Tax=Lysobacteraceae TaxID=32033 RepID=A0ABM7Q8A8_9GAMM|nr:MULTISPECIES: SH3 domain-containing protein [Lysobacter]BCT93692.1 hypothetical protein LYSCAS_27160 [Lysobacter caseinilyticus]BCT96848.1 hypothetical protein LYSHEL_27190 [Lysobacter helvus]
MSYRCIALITMAALAACTAATESKVTSATWVYETEEEAAYAGAINRPEPRPIAALDQGETVGVLDDTYGKDYWACRVRTPGGQTGWVLCTSLDYRAED